MLSKLTFHDFASPLNDARVQRLLPVLSLRHLQKRP